MIQFRRVTMKGFCAFDDSQEHVVKLNDESTLILGINNSSDAADSNGAGKSTIYKAITWCLYGETYDGDKGDDVIHNKSKGAYVELILRIDVPQLKQARKVYITRERRKRETKVTLREYHAGTSQEITSLQGHKDCVEYLEQLLGMDWLTFKNTVMYCQQDFKRFADPATTDTERKAILRRILDLDVVADAAALARSKARDVEKSLIRQSTKVSMLESTIEQATKDLIEQEAAKAGWQGAIDDKASDLKVKIGESEKIVKQYSGANAKEVAKADALIKKAVEQISEAEADMSAMEKQLAEISDEISTLKMSKSSIETRQMNIQERLGWLDEDVCPTCTAPLDSGAPAEHIKELQADLDKHNKKVEAKDKEIEQQQTAYSDAYQQLQDIKKEIDSVRGVKDKLGDKRSDIMVRVAKADEAKKRVETLKQQLDELLSETNPHNTDALKKRIKDEKDKKTRAQFKEGQFQEQIDLHDYWSQVFGKGGLINWAIDSVIPFLEQSANEYLGVLTDGDIIVNLSTSTKLKGGKSSDKISMELNVEGAGNVKPSGGQSKKVSLAISLALMALIRSRVGAKVSNLFLDEPDIGLDDAGKDRFYSKLLPVLVNQCGNLMVITHDPNVRAYFGETVHVIRDKGRSFIQ